MPSVNFGISGSKGSFSGTDVTNREATLSAGGTATIGTPGALTLDGAILSAKRVEVDAGSLTIASRQDTSTFASKDKSAGVSVSVTFAGQVSASGNLSSGKQSGDFASVETQAGIRAGEGGFGIRVAGATDLKGAVIASTADAARNSLTTGTLSASALENRETFKASSTSIGAGLGNIGQSRTGQTTTDGTGNKPAGLATPLGNLSATPPAALSASGSQASTTVSAIASGGITVTSGDTASLGVAQTISRDTSGANEALTKQFTDAKRNEIAQGFEATRQLVSEVGTFFSNRAAEQAAAKRLADAAKPDLVAAIAARDQFAQGSDDYNRINASVQSLQRIVNEPNRLEGLYGATSPIRIAATAFTGAAGGNVTGGIGSLVQSAAVNVLQSLATSKAREIADSLLDARGNPTAGSETVRAALQSVVGCAGSVAGGSNACGSAAAGAAASVVINYLLTSYLDPNPKDENGNDKPRTLEDQQARTNLVATIIAGIANGTGLNAAVATTVARIETENNDLDDDFGGPCTASTPYCRVLGYSRYFDVAVGQRYDGFDGTATPEDQQIDASSAAFYQAKVRNATMIAQGLGIATSRENLIIILEAGIGGNVTDVDFPRFVTAFGGFEGLRASIASGTSASRLGDSFREADNYLFTTMNMRASGAAPAVAPPIFRPTPQQVGFLASAIAQGGLLPSELPAFLTSVGGVSGITNQTESGATLGRQFIVNQNAVPAYDALLTSAVGFRSGVYGEFDNSLNSRGTVYRTNFFGAAANVTDLRGLTGAQSLSTVIGTPYSGDTLTDIRALGVGLYRDVNRPTYEALYSGNGSFALQSGVTVRDASVGGTQNLDYALVHAEQTYVQRFIDGLSPTRRANLIAQSNAALNGIAGQFLSPELAEAARQLGRPIDFGRQSDRELIGRITVNIASKIRQGK